MSSDRESEKTHPPRGADESTLPDDAAPTGKRLARGLADVSHLFLSQTAADSAPPDEEPAGTPSSHPPGLPADQEELLLLSRGQNVSRDQLILLLKEQVGVLEEGLRVIDGNIPCEECGCIDLLAVDRAERVCVIDVAPGAEDALLVRGASHLDWVARNMLNVRRMHPGIEANFSLPPRLLLVAPQFSSALRRAGRQLNAARVDLLRYHVVTTPGGAGVFFETVRGL